jgi:hypothetical protein
MGVDAADFDSDGDEDLFLTHLMGESNTLYVNDGGALFEDRTVEFGLAALSLAHTSFGTSWIDFDNDGLLDLLAANGAVRILEEQAAAGDPYPLRQPNQLFRNTGKRFVEVSDNAGEGFSALEVSRGVSLGDIDNDGDPDIVLHNNNGSVRLLVNQVGTRNDWVGLALARDRPASWVTGARFEVTRENGGTSWRRSRRDGSYCSSKDPRVVLGLGESKGTVRAKVHQQGNTGIREYRGLGPSKYFVFYAGDSD